MTLLDPELPHSHTGRMRQVAALTCDRVPWAMVDLRCLSVDWVFLEARGAAQVNEKHTMQPPDKMDLFQLGNKRLHE